MENKKLKIIVIVETTILSVIAAAVIIGLSIPIIKDSIKNTNKTNENQIEAEAKNQESSTKNAKAPFQFKSYEEFGALTFEMQEIYLEKYLRYKYNDEGRFKLDSWDNPKTEYEPYGYGVKAESLDDYINLKVLKQDGLIIDNYYYVKHYDEFIEYIKNKIGNRLNNYKVAIRLNNGYLAEDEEELSVEKVLNNKDLNDLDEISNLYIFIATTDNYDKSTYEDIMKEFKDWVPTELEIVNINEYTGLEYAHKQKVISAGSFDEIQENEQTAREWKRNGNPAEYTGSNRDF